MTERLKSLKQWDSIFLLLAVLFPIVLRLSSSIYHDFDVHTFVNQSTCYPALRNVYLTDCGCNYPIFGVLSTSWIMSILNGSITKFLLFLAVIESFNVLLFWLITRKMNIKANWLVLLFAILPSTWSAASYWGQIEHFGLTWLLISVFLFIHMMNASTNRSKIISGSLLGFSLLACILTKQLLIFSVFPFSVVLLALLFLREIKLTTFFFICLGGIVPFLGIELFLYIPEEYIISHYEVILSTGSDHIDLISENGINFWILFFDNPIIPSTDPLLFNFTAKQIGLCLFVLYAFFIVVSILKFIKKHRSVTHQVLILLLSVAAINIAFNVILTGTHERYLYYFYPILILFLVMNRKSEWLKISRFDYILLGIGSIIYGIFVIAILNSWLKIDGVHQNTWFNQFVAIVHIIILIRVSIWMITLNKKQIGTSEK